MKKNLLLNEGFGNSMDKNLICCSSVNSDQHSETFCVMGSRKLLRSAKISANFTSCRQQCKQLCMGVGTPYQ